MSNTDKPDSRPGMNKLETAMISVGSALGFIELASVPRLLSAENIIGVGGLVLAGAGVVLNMLRGQADGNLAEAPAVEPDTPEGR